VRRVRVDHGFRRNAAAVHRVLHRLAAERRLGLGLARCAVPHRGVIVMVMPSLVSGIGLCAGRCGPALVRLIAGPVLSGPPALAVIIPVVFAVSVAHR
jgi:hypothetical protein